MTIDNQRFLMYSLYGLGIVVWYVVWRFLGSMIDVASLAFHLPAIELPLFGSLNNFAGIVAIGISVGAVEYTRRQETANRFGIEVVSELRKVAWPSWKDVRGTTLVVVGVTVVVSLVLFVMDSIYDFFLGLMFQAI